MVRVCVNVLFASNPQRAQHTGTTAMPRAESPGSSGHASGQFDQLRATRCMLGDLLGWRAAGRLGYPFVLSYGGARPEAELTKC